MRCAFLLGFAVLAAAGDAPPAGDAANDAVLAQVSQLAGATRTAQGRYTWKTWNPGRPEPEAQEGTFALAMPDKYNLKLTRPGDPDWAKWLRSDGKTRWVVEQSFPDTRPDVTAHPVGDGDADIRRVLDCVRGDQQAMRRDFAVAAARTADGFELTLSPRTAEIAADVARLRLRLDARGHASFLALEQPSGTRIEFTVLEARYDEAIPPETFVVKP